MNPKKGGIFKKKVDRSEVTILLAIVKPGDEKMTQIVRQKVDLNKEVKTKRVEKRKAAKEWK